MKHRETAIVQPWNVNPRYWLVGHTQDPETEGSLPDGVREYLASIKDREERAIFAEVILMALLWPTD